MKRAKIQEVVKQVAERTPTPFFIRQMKKDRKFILETINMNQGEARKLVIQHSATAMRAIQILNAFIRKQKLASVESGKIDNILFNSALELAFRFMNQNAENVHNKAFKNWIETNLVEMGYGDKIVRLKNSDFII